MVGAIQNVEVALRVRVEGRDSASPSRPPVDGVVGRRDIRQIRRETPRPHSTRARDRPQDKLPVACFGKTVLWRKKRTTADLNKHDVEYSDGVFLGISGMSAELLVGTPRAVFRIQDV